MDFSEALRILGINTDPNDTEQLKKIASERFRKLTIEHHPDKGGDEETFKQIKTAYDYLTKPQLRVASQASMQTPQHSMGSLFPTDAWQMFNKFYTKLPAHLHSSNMILHDLKYVIKVTTSEMYCGVVKSIIVRRTMPDGTEQLNNYSIKIAPGSYGGQQIVLEGAGNQNIAGMKSNLIVILEEINDTQFIRDKQNLIYRQTITLQQAITGDVINLTHPSGKKMSIKYRLSSPYDTTIIPCKGMPIYGTDNSFGDLKIEYNVLFPVAIPEHLQVDVDCLLGALEYKM